MKVVGCGKAEGGGAVPMAHVSESWVIREQLVPVSGGRSVGPKSVRPCVPRGADGARAAALGPRAP